MEDNAKVNPKKRRRGNKKLNKISFDTETVTKSEAAELLKNLTKGSLEDGQKTSPKKKINRLKKNRDAQGSEEKDVGENSNNETKTGKRNRNKQKQKSQEEEENVNESEESDQEKSSDETKGKRKKGDEDEEECVTDKSGKISGEKKESKRSLKRKKFEELFKNKKKQSEDNLEKSCLEYLSNYKYNRDNWKFVKLKQIWIMENLFNEDKIDDKLWDIVVDYFENSKGGVRRILLDKALKIIEKADLDEKDVIEGEEKDEAVEKVPQVKIDRARKLIQSLQE